MTTGRVTVIVVMRVIVVVRVADLVVRVGPGVRV
jgi:hypothetical protein